MDLPPSHMPYSLNIHSTSCRLMEEDQRRPEEDSPTNLSSFFQLEIRVGRISPPPKVTSAPASVGDWGRGGRGGGGIAFRRILMGVGLVVVLRFGLPFN